MLSLLFWRLANLFQKARKGRPARLEWLHACRSSKRSRFFSQTSFLMTPFARFSLLSGKKQKKRPGLGCDKHKNAAMSNVKMGQNSKWRPDGCLTEISMCKNVNRTTWSPEWSGRLLIPGRLRRLGRLGRLVDQKTHVLLSCLKMNRFEESDLAATEKCG